ncbi:hypothetical protein EK0264_01415 [Epidermidibacterium keratini]|uniref:DUF4352 domain-containing protein n=1 Tax=Epidermidibacterium keratini TaxID=1891644 RepID=A0A7L4YIW7_9ACTN|nr:hypothetical protein [Epidermidibacterium keratini]QHB99081.1 hypothetical protein EK0264_01415 [Epidermidibacterium keratini]
MSLTDSSKKKIAGAASAVGILLFGAACSSTVSGSATYSGAGNTSSEESSSSSKKSSSSSEETTEETSTAEGGGGGSVSTDPSNPPAQAPGEAYQYDNGVKVSLAAPIVDDSLDGILSDETGRIVNITIENPSTATIDMSTYRNDSTVECPGTGSQWILNWNSTDDTGPAQLTGGQSGTYRLEVAIKQDSVGVPCLVTVIFDSPDASSIDEANFMMTF